jgi:hypothetical protein
MTWNSVWPIGNVSVKANEIPGQQNTAYIEMIMNVEHIWNKSSGLNGYHVHVAKPIITGPPQVNIGIGGVEWLQQASPTTPRQAAMFQEQTDFTVVQYIPFYVMPFQVNLTGSFVAIPITLPQNVYGEIFLWQDQASGNFGRILQTGTFITNSTDVNAYSTLFEYSDNSSIDTFVELAAGSDSTTLQIKAKTSLAGLNGVWTVFMKYYAII